MSEPYETDEALVEGLRSGDQLAHLLLVQRFGPRIKSFIKAISWDMPDEEIKEVMSDAVAKVITRISQFNPQRGRFTTWIYTIAENTVRDHVQKSASLQGQFEGEFQSYEELVETTGQDPTAIDPTQETEPRSNVIKLSRGHIIVREALKRLTPTEQKVIKEHMYGLSNPEIAILLQMREPAVRTALSRAKAHLKAVCLEICRQRGIDPSELTF
jgi:RNA polymerase sigma-70 factor (ECF subfamily)